MVQHRQDNWIGHYDTAPTALCLPGRLSLNRSAFLRSGYGLCCCPVSGVVSVWLAGWSCGAARCARVRTGSDRAGQVSFLADGVVRAGQAGAGRAHSRCQQVRNAFFHGQSRLMAKVRCRA